MTDYEIWLAYQKMNFKVGLILALILSPFVIWYAYDSYKKFKEFKRRMDKQSINPNNNEHEENEPG